jgi:outer membrane receptor protein involved in Fe transport
MDPRQSLGSATSPVAPGRFAACASIAWLAASAVVPAMASDLVRPAARPLEEVVVTAGRREQPRLEVPASLSRLGATEIAALDATHAAEALNRLPGVMIQRGSGQESLIAIRSPVLTGAGACGAFLVLEDGLPLRPPGFCNVNELFEMNTGQAAAIEVLRGPGTAIYGANAVHGVVNVVSPRARELAGARLGAEVGSDDFGRVSFAFGSTPAGPSPASAAWGTLTRDGGFRADSGTDEAKLNAAHDREARGGALRLRAAATVLDQETAGFIRGFEAYRDEQARLSNPNPEAFRDAWSARGSASWSRSECADCSDELYAMLRASGMRFLQHFLLGKPLEENEQRSLALAAARERGFGAGGTASWRAGLDLDVSTAGLRETQALPTTEGSLVARAIRPAGRHYDYEVDSLTAAAHATLTWRPAAPLALQVAARLEHTRYSYDNRMIDGNTSDDGTPCPFGGCLYSRPADRDDAFTNLAPRADATWSIALSDSLYASAARGFRPPEQTELYRLQRQQSVADLDSERIDSLEAGWRHAGPRVDASLSLFWMDKRDTILRDANGFNVSGGRTRHRGIEYEIALPMPGAVVVRASGTVVRHTYRFSRTVDGGETIRAGDDVDTAPRQLHRLLAEWSPRGEFDADLELEHTGRHFIDAANLHEYAGHTLLHARLGWQPAPGWGLSLRLRNLADRRYADRADFAQGDYRYFPGAGRQVMVGLEYRGGVPLR